MALITWGWGVEVMTKTKPFNELLLKSVEKGGRREQLQHS